MQLSVDLLKLGRILYLRDCDNTLRWIDGWKGGLHTTYIVRVVAYIFQNLYPLHLNLRICEVWEVR